MKGADLASRIFFNTKNASQQERTIFWALCFGSFHREDVEEALSYEIYNIKLGNTLGFRLRWKTFSAASVLYRHLKNFMLLFPSWRVPRAGRVRVDSSSALNMQCAYADVDKTDFVRELPLTQARGRWPERRYSCPMLLAVYFLLSDMVGNLSSLLLYFFILCGNIVPHKKLLWGARKVKAVTPRAWTALDHLWFVMHFGKNKTP